MDSNGLKFWLLADAHHWAVAGEPPALEYDDSRRALRLARQRREETISENRSVAEARLEFVPQTRDRMGNRAWYDAEWNRIVASGPDGTPVPVYRLVDDPSTDVTLTDIALGDDGVLYMAVDGNILMHDRRERWRDVVVTAEDFQAWRLAAIPGGGAWVLDRSNRKLARLAGYPLSDRAYKPYAAGVIRPCRENANPPRLTVMEDVVWPLEEQLVGLACSLQGELALLSWLATGDCQLRRMNEHYLLTEPLTLLGSETPYSIAWVSNELLAVLLTGTDIGEAAELRNEARVYRVARAKGRQWPLGDLYPLKRDYSFGPFIHGSDYPPHYPAFSTSHALHKISFPFFTRLGEAANSIPAVSFMDSGEVDTVWHRLYLEAVIPRGCGVRFWLAASNERLTHSEIESRDWFEHRFGERYQQGGRSELPVGAWESQASELPHHPGLLPCEREPGHKGLFSVLIQRAGRKVRSLSGRYLHVKLELTGPGNATPELYAVRAYNSRFSYVEHYLPKLYWETTFKPEADEEGAATQADFLERFIGNLEGVMTSLEDRIAYSDLVTRPETVPTEALDWLAEWVGFQFEAGWSESQRRIFLSRALELYQWHGTVRGLSLALDIATNGGVSGGEIVVLEDYRLRRTFATILGANLDDDEDPLTLGGIETGNSFVGDTLFIGDKDQEDKALQREFLALFSADLPVNPAEQAAIDAFFERLAYRVTILVHQGIEPQDLGMIERIAEREVPAHVLWRVLPTTAPLLVGISSLIGVDTYLTRKPPPRPARVNRSYVGRGDYVMGPAVLDRRLDGFGSGRPDVPGAKPTARASDVLAPFGEDLTLDGSASEAAPGRSLSSYYWNFPKPETDSEDREGET